MRLLLLGLSHHSAPVSLRERVAIARADLPPALATLADCPNIGEIVAVSTCNRTELYVTCVEAADARDRLSGALCRLKGVAIDELAPHLFASTDGEAVRHLFRVAAGLDSLVVGEPQILGQIKEAWSTAVGEGATGPLLNRLFHAAFTAGKRVRTETGIGAGSVSASAAAVALARKIFGSFGELRVLLVGAGEMAKLAGLHFRAQHVGRLTVTSRTDAHAGSVAEALGATVTPWSDLDEALGASDIVVTATGASTPVLSRASIARALRARGRRPLFIIDLGMPRDVDPAAGGIDDVFLYNIDDLQSIVADGVAKRQRHIEDADRIVAEEADRFERWYRSREALPAMVALRERFDAIRRSELQRLAPKLAGLPPDARARIDEVTRLIVEKLLLMPTEQLKQLPDEETALAYSSALSRLFILESGVARPAEAHKAN